MAGAARRAPAQGAEAVLEAGSLRERVRRSLSRSSRVSVTRVTLGPAGGAGRGNAAAIAYSLRKYTPHQLERRWGAQAYTHAIDPSRRAPSRGATWTAATPALPPLLRCAAPTHAHARHSHRARGSTRTPTASCHARQPHRGDVAGREVVGEAAGRAATRTIPSRAPGPTTRRAAAFSARSSRSLPRGLGEPARGQRHRYGREMVRVR